MEVKIQTIVSEIQAILGRKNGKEQFVYGDFNEEPSLPYGNYAIDDTRNIFSDNVCEIRQVFYVIRLVTGKKNFALEKRIEDVFTKYEIAWECDGDENFKRDRVNVTEWTICLVESKTR